MTFKEQRMIKKEAKALFTAGKNRGEIYDLLKEKAASSFEQDWLASHIGGLVKKEEVLKYKFHIAAICILFITSIIVWLYYPYDTPEPFKYLLHLVTLFWIWLIITAIRNYNAGYLYSVMTIGVLIVIILLIRGFFQNNIFLILFALIPASVSFSARYTLKKLAPGFMLSGKIKKDDNGNYLFNN